MIKGLGIDIIEIQRVKEAAMRHEERFIKRLFTSKEEEYCHKFKDPYPHFAGRFAAKEAIFKALGTGLQKEMHWHDLEIIGDENGKPEVHISSNLKNLFPNVGILVSISHCKEYATAVAQTYGL